MESARPSEIRSRRNRLAQIFSAAGHFYIHMFTAMYFVIAYGMEEAGWREMSYEDLSKLWSLGALLVGVAALPAGWLSDRWSARGMMVVYFLGMGGATIICGLVDAPTALFIGLTAIGLFAAIYHPVGIAWLVRNAEKRGKALGINGIFGALGIGFVGVLAGWLTQTFSWRMAFIVPGALCLVTGAALMLAVKLDLVGEGRAVTEDAQPLSKNGALKGFVILLGTMVMMGFMFQAVQASLSKHFGLQDGGDVVSVGLSFSAAYMIGSFIQLGGGHLADRFPLKMVYGLCFLLQALCLAALGYVSGAPLLVAAIFVIGFSTAGLPAENLLLAHYTPAKHHALAYGLKFVLAFGFAPVAIFTAAEIRETTGSYLHLYLLLAGLGVLAFLATVFLPRIGRGAPAPRPQAAE